MCPIIKKMNWFVFVLQRYKLTLPENKVLFYCSMLEVVKLKGDFSTVFVGMGGGGGWGMIVKSVKKDPAKEIYMVLFLLKFFVKTQLHF